MEKIKGVNLGNWLVLEKWMLPEMFAGTGAEDEVWLNRKVSSDELKEKMKKHRDTFITEKDFAFIKEQGIGLLRIPVPYFIFGDREPFNGCIEYLDKAFDWAEKYGLQILIDLHTVPGSQNGYDNGGITGVCKWCKNPQEVEFALTVLERLAERYKNRVGLYGIEVLNEPISFLVYATAPSTGKAVDKEEAKGSSYVPMPFLENFYRNAYKRLRQILPENKTIVFHDGFRLRHWRRFFRKENMKNVVLDTHIYIFAMESFVPVHKPWVYQIYIKSQQRLIRRHMLDQNFPGNKGSAAVKLLNKGADQRSGVLFGGMLQCEMLAAHQLAAADEEGLDEGQILLLREGDHIAVLIGIGMLQLLLLGQQADAGDLIPVQGGLFKIHGLGCFLHCMLQLPD